GHSDDATQGITTPRFRWLWRGRWPGRSGRTLIGSACGFLAYFLFNLLLSWYLDGSSMLYWARIQSLLRHSILCTLWEAVNCDLNDNLSLPLVALLTSKF